MGLLPIYQQVLFHSEALCAAIAVEAVVRPAEFWLAGAAVVAVTVALRQLGQLVLDRKSVV